MVHTYSNTKGKKFIKVGDRVIGHLEGNKFTKLVAGSRHKLRCPPAWAIDADAFDSEIKPNVTEIVVIDKETGLEYHCSLETFDKFKGELDRRFGRQYFVTLNHWEIRGSGCSRQLSLFNEGVGDA